mgnify:FL=1
MSDECQDEPTRLVEIQHKPVHFTGLETMQKDTEEVNSCLRAGWVIQDQIRTDTGIVYVLSRWEKLPVKPEPHRSEDLIGTELINSIQMSGRKKRYSDEVSRVKK